MMPRGATRWPTRGGAFVAVVGFVLTWYTVVDSLRPDVALPSFLVGQAPVLVAGFGLTAFGVALAVSSQDPGDVDLIAQWCAGGTLSMGAVVAVTYVGAGVGLPAAMESRLVANVLVAGAVGGTLTGVRSAATRRHRRDVARKADRLTVLNRLLRHEVLNKVNVVKGYAGDERPDRGEAESLAVIRRNADAIGETVDRVGALTGSESPAPVDLLETVDEAVGSARRRHPEVTVETGERASATVLGTPQFDALFSHLIESAVIRGATRVRLDVEDGEAGAGPRVRLVTDGAGPSAAEKRLVAERATPDRDDPRSGFGLSVGRLLAEEVGGSLRVETDGAVVVSLPRADGRGRFGADPARLRRSTVAALAAGGAMGLLVQFVSGTMPVIGTLYGVENVAVGWVTHQFHSVCFGLWFVASTATWARDDPLTLGALGAGYGAVLWLVAAGLVMPLWLRAVGVPAPLPNFALPSLGHHLVWGVVFGGLYGWLCGGDRC
jgi:signal transduction histidine kinase